jgi:uncharacterized YccA/Bax inhibitor family protein
MAIFRTSNPAFTENFFNKSTQIYSADAVKMTERGTLNKFFLLALLVIASASLTWKAFFDGRDVYSWMIVSGIAGFIIAFVLIYNPLKGAFLAPLYALCKGVFIGGISAMFSYQFAKTAPGIVLQAVCLTFGTVIAMFLLYRFQIIKVTEKFKGILFTAMIGLLFFYLLAFVLRLFHIDIPYYQSGSFGIGFSIFVIGIASMMLVLNFDNIQKGVDAGLPRIMEWYFAFGLILVIIWLYIQMLQLLAQLNSRN